MSSSTGRHRAPSTTSRLIRGGALTTGAALASIGLLAGPAAASEHDWSGVAECESSGNWAINTGNGYYGGLQFSLSTWQAYGGPGYPHQQSRETQIAIAEKVRAATGGYGSWPHCSQQLGLPQ